MRRARSARSRRPCGAAPSRLAAILLAMLLAACTSGLERVTAALSPGMSMSPSASGASLSPSTSPVEPSALASGGDERAIVVHTPQPGDEVQSPATISGTANVFEATVSIELLDAARRQLAATFTTATCGSGCRGSFSTEVSFFTASRQNGFVRVFESSAEDGSRLHVVEIPVVLVPGS